MIIAHIHVARLLNIFLKQNQQPAQSSQYLFLDSDSHEMMMIHKTKDTNTETKKNNLYKKGLG